jgi:uncharacterized protein (TIGR02996 family)
MTATISPAAAFLAAVLESPDDDAPRLIYGDWLLEQGDPRGEFIAVQCRLARLAVDDPQRLPLQTRERRLLAEHGDSWAPIAGLGREPVYRRGFVEGLTLDAEEFLTHGGELFQATPLRQVWLQRAAGLVEAVAASPLLTRLTDLDLSGNPLDDAEIRALANSPYAINLTRLSLTGTGLSDAGFRALLQSRHLRGLVELNLQMNQVAVSEGESESFPPRLAALNLFSNRLGVTGAERLARSAVGHRLTRLHLGRNGLGDAGARALARAPFLARLRVLNLADNAITDDGALVLARAGLENLDQLVLRGNLIGFEVRQQLKEMLGNRLRV